METMWKAILDGVFHGTTKERDDAHTLLWLLFERAEDQQYCDNDRGLFVLMRACGKTLGLDLNVEWLRSFRPKRSTVSEVVTEILKVLESETAPHEVLLCALKASLDIRIVPPLLELIVRDMHDASRMAAASSAFNALVVVGMTSHLRPDVVATFRQLAVEADSPLREEVRKYLDIVRRVI